MSFLHCVEHHSARSRRQLIAHQIKLGIPASRPEGLIDSVAPVRGIGEAQFETRRHLASKTHRLSQCLDLNPGRG